jgi:AraC family transcriptional regulator
MNQLIASETKLLGISLDDPFITRPDRCRYYACMSVNEEQKYSPAKFISTLTIPEGKFAIFEVKSRPEDLKFVYQTIFSEWLLKSGYQPANAYLYEVYVKSSDEVLDETMNFQIHIPIEPIQG